MNDYSECLIKINQGLEAYRKAILQNKTFEAFVIAEDLKNLCQWLEGWTYEKVKRGDQG